MLFLPYHDQAYGYLLPYIVQKIPWPKDFEIDEDKRYVHLRDLSEGEDPAGACTSAFAKIVDKCLENDLFHVINRHSELYSILGTRFPIRVERFARQLFGLVGRGAHLTVYTTTPSGLKIWVPRRSAHMRTWPNLLDSTVAGGVAANETPFENVVREADEEASLPQELVRSKAHACGIITYINRTKGSRGSEQGLISPNIVYLFDLEVDENVIPKPKDGEVQEFSLMGVEEVQAALKRQEFKPNSAVVMIDFFIRHGILTPDNEEDYVEIITRMHRQLPFLTAPYKTTPWTQNIGQASQDL